VAGRRAKTANTAPEPTSAPEAIASLDDRPLVERAINRAIAEQYAQAAQEVDRIVDATYRVIEREGTVEPRIRDILQEAGLATQAFYRHFRSKDELLLVILDDGRRRLAQYLVHRMEKASGPVAEVRAWIEGMLAQAADPGAASRTSPTCTRRSSRPRSLCSSTCSHVPCRTASTPGSCSIWTPSGLRPWSTASRSR
jgi:hypothetical protein